MPFHGQGARRGPRILRLQVRSATSSVKWGKLPLASPWPRSDALLHLQGVRRGATTPVFPIDSMQMNRDHRRGALRGAFPEKQVQMKGQDVTVGVEAVEGTAYVYARSLSAAIGGLPVGIVGQGGVPSVHRASTRPWPPGAWLAAAPCPSACISPGRPQTSDAIGVPGGRHRARARAHRLHRARLRGALRRLPARDIALPCPPSLRVILYRRLMFQRGARSWRGGKGPARW